MHAEALSADQRRAFPNTVRPSEAQLPPELDRFLSLHEVMRLTTLAKATIYRRISLGAFPRPIPLSRTKVAWSARDIALWQQDQRDAPSATNDPPLTIDTDIAA